MARGRADRGRSGCPDGLGAPAENRREAPPAAACVLLLRQPVAGRQAGSRRQDGHGQRLAVDLRAPRKEGPAARQRLRQTRSWRRCESITRSNLRKKPPTARLWPMPTSGIASGDPNPIEKEHVMASKVNRRRFLKSAATGIAAGAAATAAGSALAAENPPLAPIPVPDAQTKPAATGTGPQPVCCGAAAQVIFACSGSADVGKIADLAARKLRRKAWARCLAWREWAGE